MPTTFSEVDAEVEAQTTEQGAAAKVIAGNWKDLNKRDGLSMLAVLGYGAGKLGVVGTAAEAVVSGVDANSKYNRERKLLGIDDATYAHSEVGRQADADRSAQIKDGVANSAVSGAASIGAMAAAGGAMAAAAEGAAAGTLLGGPFGTIIGGAVGMAAGVVAGMGASKAYSALFKSETKDTQALFAKIRMAQLKGFDMPVEAVGAALLSTLPEHARKKIEDELETKTGTRSFHKAVQEERYGVIRELMKKYDLDIRAQTGVIVDANDPDMTVAEQLTPLLNARQLDARALIADKDNLPIFEAMQKAEQLRANGVSTDNGFSIDPSSTSNFPPFPEDTNLDGPGTKKKWTER